MRRQLRACLIAVSLVVANMPSALATAFTFTTIDVPGAPTNSTGINDTGQIVGTFFAGTHGYLLSGGTFTTIDVPGAFATFANGINGLGQIVGFSHTIGPPPGTRGYLLSGGTFTTIDVPGASCTVASGINGTGQIVGAFQDATGFHGYLLSGGTFTTIDVPGASSTDANGINDTGQIVGTFSDAAGTHGYLLSGGTFTTIDVPGAPTNSTGINAMGQIVGSFGQIEAFEPEDLHGYLANVLPKMSITTNRTSFGRTDMLTVSVGVGNPGFPAVVDFYFGALLPDGHTVVFFNDLEFHSAVGDLAKPADLRPIVAGVDLSTPFTFSQHTFFEYTWTGGEPSGRYLLFVAAVHPGTFADNSIDAGDIVAVSTAAVLFVTGDSSDQAADAGVLPNGRQSTGLQR
jgi:probable HAF family extracellular repeat protein